MLVQTGFGEIERDPRSVVTVGTFDGVHLGHQAVLAYLKERAREQGGHSTVVTFDPHPREVVRGEAVPLLSTIQERADLLQQLGLDRLVVIPFTQPFSRLPAAAFIEEVLVGQVGLREVVIGYDHGFGRGREGDSDLLEALGERLGFSVDVIPARVVADHVVSSTEIRGLLQQGQVRAAAKLLGRGYRLGGEVVQGDGRGRQIGFPTANLQPTHARKVVPGEGVYAVRVRGVGEGARRGGMMNVGRRPTFGGAETRLEVHLFDFRGDLYGATLQVEFVARIRQEQRFDGVEALVEQLYRDRSRCLEVLEAAATPTTRPPPG